MISTSVNLNTYFSDNNKIGNGSSLVLIDLYDSSGAPINISQTRKPILIQIPQTISSMTPVPQLTSAGMSDTDPSVSLSYFSTVITNNDSSLTLEIVPIDKSVQLLVLVRYNDYPSLNTTDMTTRGWDYLQLVPASLVHIGEHFAVICSDRSNNHWPYSLFAVLSFSWVQYSKSREW